MFALAIFIFGLVKSFKTFQTEYTKVPSACMISVVADGTTVYSKTFESQFKVVIFQAVAFLFNIFFIISGTYKKR